MCTLSGNGILHIASKAYVSSEQLNDKNPHQFPHEHSLFLQTTATMWDSILLGKKVCKIWNITTRSSYIFGIILSALGKPGYVCKNSKDICKPKSNLQINKGRNNQLTVSKIPEVSPILIVTVTCAQTHNGWLWNLTCLHLSVHIPCWLTLT